MAEVADVRSPTAGPSGPVAVLVAYALFQAALALGAPWGRLAWGGRHRVLPDRLRRASAVSSVGFAALARHAAGPVAGGRRSARFQQGLAAYFALGTVVNAVSPSRAERVHAVPAAYLALAFLRRSRSPLG